MNFTDPERKTLMATRSITRDAQGREVLVGLTDRETVRYMRYVRKGGSRYRGDREMHEELRAKHERARAEAIEVEYDLEMRIPPRG